jgi:hypothetical protein
VELSRQVAASETRIASTFDTSAYDPDPQPELAFIDPLASEILHAGDSHEVLAVRDVVVRDREMRCVREVERLETELKPEVLGYREFAQDSEVPVEQARSAQEVVAGIAEACRVTSAKAVGS